MRYRKQLFYRTRYPLDSILACLFGDRAISLKP